MACIAIQFGRLTQSGFAESLGIFQVCSLKAQCPALRPSCILDGTFPELARA